MLAPLDLVILVTLSRESVPIHGYELLQNLRAAHEVEVATTSLYRALRHLLERGYVVEAPPEPGADPRRRCYQLTSTGTSAVTAERARLTRLFSGELRPTGAAA